MSPKPRLLRIPSLATLACLALMAFAVSESAAASPRTCAPPKDYPGAGYFTATIRATNISCSYSRSFVVSFYNCRTKSGTSPSGTCRRVRGFTCTERRNSIPTEINSTVTCRRGGTQRIVHSYQQNLGE